MRTMTSYEVTIIGYEGEGVTAYEGNDEGEFERAVQSVRTMLTRTPHNMTATIRYEQDGSIWANERIFFLR